MCNWSLPQAATEGRRAASPLHVNAPTKYCELFLNVGERKGEGRSAMRIRSPLGEDAFALQFEGLPLTFAFGFFGEVCLRIRLRGRCLCLLFFHGFTLPSTRHVLILRPALRRACVSHRSELIRHHL